jgi:hypothetical protein
MWRNYSIFDLGENGGIEVGKLALPLKQQMISTARVGCCSPVFYAIFHTAIGILEYSGELPTRSMPRNRLASVLNSRSVALLRISCYR